MSLQRTVLFATAVALLSSSTLAQETKETRVAVGQGESKLSTDALAARCTAAPSRP
jgi:hypothetical protein